MAGYQNKLGFSGNKLDNILKDVDYKATPHNISFAIDAGWNGTEAAGSYPATGEGELDNFPSYSAFGDYQEIGIILHFSFLGKPVYAQIQSKMILATTEEIVYFVPFIGQDTSSNYHEYLLKIRRSTNSTDSSAASFRVTAVHPI